MSTSPSRPYPYYDREPQPSEGPDYHADHRAWEARRDQKWMRLCVAGAKSFSTCAKRQYMAIVVDTHGHVLATGYNGAPKGMTHCADGGCPRLREHSPSGSPYDNCVAIHAEQNALLHSDYTARRDGGTMYVNGPPCFTCARLIANSGLKRLAYTTDPGYADWPHIADFLRAAGIDVVPVFLWDDANVA